MYKRLIDTAKEIIRISELNKEEMFQGKDSIEVELDFSDSLEELIPNKYEIKLTEILNNLSFDEVLALETIMYLGRDKDYDSQMTADEIFKDCYSYFYNRKESKEIEIDQMVGKFTLGEYLKAGYEILGINL